MKRPLAVCFALTLATGSAAQADWLITSTSVRIIDGPYAGDNQITFRAQNTGTGQTMGTSKLLAMDVTMQAYVCFRGFGAELNGHLFIHTYDADRSGKNDDADFSRPGRERDSAQLFQCLPALCV